MSTGWESQPASGGDNIASVDDSAPTKVILAPFPSSSPLPDTPVHHIQQCIFGAVWFRFYLFPPSSLHSFTVALRWGRVLRLSSFRLVTLVIRCGIHFDRNRFGYQSWIHPGIHTVCLGGMVIWFKLSDFGFQIESSPLRWATLTSTIPATALAMTSSTWSASTQSAMVIVRIQSTIGHSNLGDSSGDISSKRDLPASSRSTGLAAAAAL